MPTVLRPVVKLHVKSCKMVVDFYKAPVSAHENDRYIEYGVSVQVWHPGPSSSLSLNHSLIKFNLYQMCLSTAVSAAGPFPVGPDQNDRTTTIRHQTQ